MRQMTMLPDRVHFIGGCGRAMSGVMAAVAGLGVRVTGSDDEKRHASATAARSGLSAPYRPWNS